MKVLLINDCTSNCNWGGRAATASLMAMITAAGGDIVRSVPERDLLETSFDRPSTGRTRAGRRSAMDLIRPFVPPVLMGLRRRVVRGTAGSAGSRLIPRRWEDFEASAAAVLGARSPWPDLLQAIERCDVAVINGEGSMVGNGILPRTELFLAYLVKKHLDRPVIIVNHIADLGHPDLREMAHEVYPLFDDVAFRDPVSVERCKAFCAGRLAPDTAFSFQPIEPEAWRPVARRPTFFDVWPDTARLDPSRPYLCLGGSSIFGGKRDRRRITEQYALLVTHLQAVYSGQIVLTVSGLVDQAVLRPIAESLELPLIGVNTPVQQAVDILGNADAYVGGRYHPSIFALRGGAPIVALSAKSFKMQALADEAGLSASAFDALNVGTEREAIGRRLLSLLAQGGELRSSLRAWAERQAEKSWENVTYLREWHPARSSRSSAPERRPSASG